MSEGALIKQMVMCSDCEKIFDASEGTPLQDVKCPDCGSGKLSIAFCMKPIWVKEVKHEEEGYTELLGSEVPKEGYVLHQACRRRRIPIFGCYEPLEKEGKEG